MIKKLMFFSAFILASSIAFANTTITVEITVDETEISAINNQLSFVECDQFRSGTLSCGIGFSVCGNSEEELDSDRESLECLVCNKCKDAEEDMMPIT